MFDPADWHSHVEAKKQIAEAARNASTPGFVISNPITHARRYKKLKASADPEQAIVANLVQDVTSIKRQLEHLQHADLDLHHVEPAVEHPLRREPDGLASRGPRNVRG